VEDPPSEREVEEADMADYTVDCTADCTVDCTADYMAGYLAAGYRAGCTAGHTIAEVVEVERKFWAQIKNLAHQWLLGSLAQDYFGPVGGLKDCWACMHLCNCHHSSNLCIRNRAFCNMCLERMAQGPSRKVDMRCSAG
jgi:hypothetical protein